MSYLSFVYEGTSASGKTRVWSVVSGGNLGSISWYAPWRKYCFYPSGSTIFDSSCMLEIAEFLGSETARHKEGL